MQERFSPSARNSSANQTVSHACGFWRIHRGQSHRGGMVKAQAGAGTLFVSSCGSWEGVKPCPIQRFFPLSVRFCTHTQEGNTHTVSRGWWTHPNVLLPRGVTLLHPASCNEFHAPLSHFLRCVSENTPFLDYFELQNRIHRQVPVFLFK